MQGRLEKMLIERDVFGHKIGVHYMGKDSF